MQYVIFERAFIERVFSERDLCVKSVLNAEETKRVVAE